MIAAASASRRVGHDYIGTEHLLLALTDDRASAAARVLASHGLSADRVSAEIVTLIGIGDSPRGRDRRGVDADALATLGIDPDEIRRHAEDAFGRGALERTWAGCTPVAPRLKRALEFAAYEAGEAPISAEHVLVGLASVRDCVAAQILTAHGITIDRLRLAVTGEPPGHPAA